MEIKQVQREAAAKIYESFDKILITVYLRSPYVNHIGLSCLTHVVSPRQAKLSLPLSTRFTSDTKGKLACQFS